jgi:hypothetical protein
VDRGESLDAFHFNDDFVLNDEIWSMLGYQLATVVHRDSDLPGVDDPLRPQFDTECRLVNTFKETGTMASMDFHRAADNPPG